MTVFLKIYKNSKKEALRNIISSYKIHGFLVVNYIYFANLVSNGIIGGKKVNKKYLDSLIKGDFLLPDGIALKLYYKKYYGIELSNLNGTDFSDYYLSFFKNSGINLILYGGKEDIVKKASEKISKKFGLDIFYYQDGYNKFNFNKLKSLPEGRINILLVGLGTPKQEEWTIDNKDNIIKYKLLVFTQGGTFDFLAGNEKRAPKIIIKLKCEWLWRFITNPKKNFKKVYYSFYLFYFIWFKKKSK